jgi:DNA-binding transcriptional MerR regulator
MPEQEYSIQELCDQTGLPRRTIHFYIQQGILPPPQGSGLGARYQQDHLIRLKLMPQLRQQGLKLDDIRAKFQSSDRTALEQLFKHSGLSLHSPATVPASQPAAQPYQAFHLSHGIIVLAPQGLSPEIQARLEQWLQSSELDR